MSYTRETISDSAAAIPSMPPQQVREAREVDPYAHANRLAKADAAVTANGQPNKDSSAPAETGKTEETVTLSPQMAALARKEQKFRQQQQLIKDKEVALEKERAEIAEFKAMKEALDKGDYSVLDKSVAYDKWTQWKIDQSSTTTPEQQALKELATKVDSVEKAHKDDVTKRFEAAVNDRRNAVKALVETNPEFAGIKKSNMQEAVVQHILDTWEHDNTELTPEQAAKEVTMALKEKATAWKSFLEEEPAPAPVEDKKQLPPLKQGIKTLTNQMAPTGEIKRPAKSYQHMSDSERWAEARRRVEEKSKVK